MIILLTNDDGIHAEGIHALGDALLQNEDNRIFIAAPDRERSATGHAITMHRPLRAETVKFLHNNSLKGWSINGTPADCVKLAIEYLLPQKPDLVISGINHGANLGTDVLYSGTVSAAIEATILGIPAIAVSLTAYENPDFRFSANFMLRLLKVLEGQDLPEKTLLNINVPGVVRREIAGVAITYLGLRRYRNAFQKRIDPRGRSYFWMAGELDDTEDEEEGSDGYAISRCNISITPVHFDLTNHMLIEQLKKIDWEI
ncbi:MAG TPA: 5'/3'-nucleotidase SurE [Firmicutes bacterium]|nr:5'/3'-nucleotidase SurE [Bacillota bacterium]